MKKTLIKSVSVFLAIIFNFVYLGQLKEGFGEIFSVKAKAASVSDLTFALNEDGESYSVVACNAEAEGEIDIPDTYDNLPVTAIEEAAFATCEYLYGITIPDTITSIGDFAFYGCIGLEKIEIPESVTSIGYFFVIDCMELSDIIISENNPNYASIDGVLFDKDKSMLIQYPAGKTDAAYMIPDGVTIVGPYSFYYSVYLKEITIPSSLASVYEQAFYDCYLDSVYLTDITAWCSMDFEDADANPLYNADNLYLNGELVTELVLPGDVTSVAPNTFYGYEKLTSVTILEGTTSIDSAAFSSCTNLVSLTIPDSLLEICDDAFSDCVNLESVEFGDGLKSIGGSAFYNCKSLTSINLTENVTSIGNYSFYGCEKLKTVTLPDNVTNIGSSAFSRCTNLMFVCNRNSFAQIYADANNISCIFNEIGATFDITRGAIYIDVVGCSLDDVVCGSEDVTCTASQSYIGTGVTVSIIKSGSLHSQYTLVVNGDTNGDSACDVLDCFDVERASNGNAELTGVYAMAADSNLNGIVDVADYQSIINKALAS